MFEWETRLVRDVVWWNPLTWFKSHFEMRRHWDMDAPLTLGIDVTLFIADGWNEYSNWEKVEPVMLDPNAKMVEFDDGILGVKNLVEDGGERIAQKYLLFPKTLMGVRRRGTQLVKQKAVVNVSSEGETVCHYNTWVDTKFTIKEVI